MPYLSEAEYEELNALSSEVSVSDAEYETMRARKLAQATSPEQVLEITRRYPALASMKAEEADRQQTQASTDAAEAARPRTAEDEALFEAEVAAVPAGDTVKLTEVFAKWGMTR